MDSLSLIAGTLRDRSIGTVLDVGCGKGHLARGLARHGIATVGLDPDLDQAGAARNLLPEGRVCVGRAERLPFADGSFRGAVFLNSLHHVPGMAEALGEAARVVGPGGVVVVIEPLTEGSFFDVFLPVEDETAVRQAAQQTVSEAIADGLFGLGDCRDYERPDAFTGLDQFLKRVTDLDPARRISVDANRAEIARRFSAQAETAPDGRFVLVQPLRAHILIAA